MYQRLSGGNTNQVVRDGDVVRRQTGPWTPSVHRLLIHLRDSGIDWVPEARAIDPAGYEVLSYLPGTVPQYPMPSWVWGEAVLDAAARRLRELHDATSNFDRTGCTWRLESREPAEVICHNDAAPYNMVFDDDRMLVGLIDFDAAAPGPRLWDLAYLAYRLVPLHDLSNPEVPSTTDEVRLMRLTRLLDVYGHPASVRSMLQTCIERVVALREFTNDRALETGDEKFLAHMEIYEADLTYLRRLVDRLPGSGCSRSEASRGD